VARQAIIAAISDNDEALRQSYASARQSPSADGGIALVDAVYYLYNSTRDSREEFLYGQEVLAANAKNKDWRNKILLSLLTDEVYELNRLEGQNRFNKYTRIFNRVSTSLSQLILLQPQAAASLLWDGMYGFKQGKAATVKERKMVFLSDQFLKKFPNAPERNEVVALRQELKQKMLSDRAKALAEAGKKAVSEGKFQLAAWHLEKASLLDPANADTAQLLAKSRELSVRMDEVRGLTLGVSDAEMRLPKPQQDAIGDMARALISGKTKTLSEIRSGVPYTWDSVDFAFAAMSEKAGDHGAALTRLQSVASSAPDSPGGRAAIKLLDNPNYNLNENFQQALEEMNSDQNHFIWTGRRSKDETVYAAGSTVISSAGNPVTVPILFGMDAAVRAISEKFRTQVDVDGVIDAGARYLKKYPKSPRSKEIAAQLATLSKKAGDYKRSMDYLEESGGGTSEDIAKLRKNQAVALYEQVKNSSDLLDRKQLLEKLANEYPDEEITKKNLAKELAKLPPSLAKDTIVLAAEALRADQQLAQYLGVAPHLVDGSRGNGEVTAEGVAITPSAEVIEYKLQKEDTWRRFGLVEQGRDWILTAARQRRQEYLTTVGSRDLLYRQKAPIAIKGGVGAEGVDVAPQILQYPTSQQDKQRFQ